MWFVGNRRTGGATRAEILAAQLRRAELRAGEHENAMALYEREHNALAKRMRRLESELEPLRRERLEAYTRWWNAREDRDRARHIARRLRRRIDRVSRRLQLLTRSSEG